MGSTTTMQVRLLHPEQTPIKKTMDKIQTALNIINSFNWGWRMEDANYKRNLIKAQEETKRFMSVLKEIEEKDVVKALRDIWIAHYDLAQPYEDAAYYQKKKTELKDAQSKLEQYTIKQYQL